jgi:neurocan core protein
VVEPFSSSARVEIQEPDATGGVPVLRYRAEWKTVGRGSWVQKVYEVQGGEYRGRTGVATRVKRGM